MKQFECVIFDWAGTTVDYGCFAPVQAFVEVFKHYGIEPTMEEVREPMGMLKIDHIRTMLNMPRIKKCWTEKYGKEPTEENVKELFGIFEEKLMSILHMFADPKPGVPEVIRRLRAKGYAIGSTTGYTDKMMEIVAPAAKEKGYEPDCWFSPDSTAQKGRPYPYMIYRNMEKLGIRDVRKVIKVGDTVSDIKEGKIELIADIDGVLKIRREALLAVNSLGEMMIASRHGDFPVKKGDKLAGTRIIPLVIEKEKMDRAAEVAGTEPIFSILPYKKKKVGIVTTGSEVQKGLITDTFTPVLRDKFAKFPSEVIGQTKPGDDMEQITADILKFIEEGADMVVCSGGMSVDPDDRTPGAIKATGTRIVSYGAPVLPGAMMLVSYYEKDGRQIPILGLPGCVMYAKNTIFDLLLPRLMADDEITLSEINQLGEGGLCLNCDVCTFPNCGFGK